jgi:hypothetical protein
MSSTEVAQIKETLDEHWEVLQSISQNQTNMMHLLQGNPINPKDTGLLGRIAATEEDVRVMKAQRDRLLWGVGGVVFVCGIIYGFIELIK